MGEVASIELACEKVKSMPKTRGFRFTMAEDGSAEVENTGPMEANGLLADAAAKAGVDLDRFDVEVTRMSAWEQGQKDGDTVVLHSVRARITPKTAPGVDLLRLVDEVREATRREAERPQPLPGTGEDESFVVMMGDLQLGKTDGDGLTGAIARWYEATELACRRYLAMPAAERPSTIVFALLGDLVEGHVSQGGQLSWRTALSSATQQVTFHRLLVDATARFAAIAPHVRVVAVPGNHDEVSRSQSFDAADSLLTAAVGMLAASCAATGAWPHVDFITPERERWEVTIDISGVIVGMAHGHKFASGPGGWQKWLDGQVRGRQPAGHADLLLAGHLHHLHVEHLAHVAFVQAPAMESESGWFKARTGEGGSPGFVTLIVGERCAPYRDLVLHHLTNRLTPASQSPIAAAAAIRKAA